MLVLRPSTALPKSSFSRSVMPSRGLVAFSTPLGCEALVYIIKIESSRISTYSKLNRDREEVDAGGLGDGLTAGNTRQVDVAGLNKALLALDSAEHLFGESEVSC